MINLKVVIVAFAAISCMAGCSMQPETSYTVTGNIEGLSDGVHVQLVPVSHENEKPIADTTLVDGKFVFKGAMKEPLAVRLTLKDAYGSKVMMLENADIRIDGKVSLKETDGTPSYDLSGLSVSGSSMTDKYIKLLSVRNRLDSIYQADNETFKDVRAAHQKAYVAKDKKMLDSLMATEEYKASVKADSTFFAIVEATYSKTIMDNKDTFWGPLMMISLLSYFTEEQNAWYEAFSQEAKDSYYGRKVKEELFPTSKEGTKVADFTAKGQDGSSVTLADLCKDKKYVLIDFWASWCSPCRKEIPHLKKLYAKYADKGFQIVSISIDKKKADWEKALKEEKLTWPNFLDTEGIADLYKVKLIPTMYLIDGQGVMVGENLRGEELENKLAALFGNNAK
ncbi:TlpA disulfide reductase family protein [Bacteroides ovatus]|uniref:Peroxiredoxin n=1 Tax=Bacteroides ovatus TaxID=28116 RepID=A0A1G8K0D0_BACOV|nr:TlpA disulfide reductase family protein [Bacteroides ovatus]SDI36888.1 Peroxiredoxin [Bacteroides ovatus]